MSRDLVLRQEWTARLQPLKGRTIVGVRYMDEKDMANCGWDRSAVILVLDDGTIMWPSADDEGNGPGALYIQPSGALKEKGVGDGAPVI